MPSIHGIVGNVFHTHSDSLQHPTFGSETPYASEALWEVADRQGKQVIRIGSLRLHGAHTAHRGARVLGQSRPVGKDTLLSLQPIGEGEQDRISEGSRLQSLGSFSISFMAPNPTTKVFHAFAMHRLDTQSPVLILDTDEDVSNGFAVQLGERGTWTPLALGQDRSFKIGTWIKVVDRASDLSRVNLQDLRKKEFFVVFFSVFSI